MITETNSNYESIFFTINVQTSVFGRIFKQGQQFKWSSRFWTRTCECGDGFWTYFLEEQIDGCKLERQMPVTEIYGCQDSFQREWIENDWVEDRQGVGKDILHQPHQKQDSLRWYTKDGYLKTDGI